jgi:hypothetical protein
MLVRLALTAPSAILMGWLIQKGIERTGGLDITSPQSGVPAPPLA